MGPLDRYTCEEMFRRLDDYVDRELTPDEIKKVDEHLATCAECAGEYAFEEALLQELKNRIRRIEVPQSAIDKVKAVLAASGPNGLDAHS